MQLTVLGCGDAFGTGGRLQTAFLVEAPSANVLLDCGASVLIGFERSGIDPANVDIIVITHLHGDHFAGLVWYLLHARHVARRTKPLTILGPVGLQTRLTLAFDALYRGSGDKALAFDLNHVTFGLHEPVHSGPLTLKAFEARHETGGLATMVRLELDGRTIAFSGDTAWVDDLIPCAADADLFITECYARETPVVGHLDWPTLSKHLPGVTARRVAISHMGRTMLDAVASGDLTPRDPRLTFLEDGQKIEI